LIKFRFTNEPGLDSYHNPLEFSKNVYLIMAAMNQIGKPNNDTICKYMQDIIGGNMGFIFRNEAKSADDAKMVTAMIRDRIKSALRGVTDFTKYPEFDKSGKSMWYPKPSEHKGGKNYNVFNLDPYVYFVHRVLEFSGYGFSLDDDTADIGAGGATQMQLTISGNKDLKLDEPYAAQVPFGAVKNVPCKYFGKDKLDFTYLNMKSVSATTPVKVTTNGAHNYTEDQIVHIEEVSSIPNGDYRAKNVTKDTFEVYSKDGKTPIAPQGSYTQGGKVSPQGRPYIYTGDDLTKVFYRVWGDDGLRTYQGAKVTVKDMAQGEVKLKNPVRVTERGKPKIDLQGGGQQTIGQLILSDPLVRDDGTPHGTPLEPGDYIMSFTAP
jgi:hypothetical protein